MNQLIKHGCSVRKHHRATKEYNAWCSMKKRCFNKKNPSYEHYGARGITVCERWKNSFINFLKDIGEAPSLDHSIDRIDVNGDYGPSNCRWATIKEQNANRRQRKNEIYFNNEGTREAGKRLGGWKGLVYDRIRKGWSIQDAFTVPVKPRKEHFNE